MGVGEGKSAAWSLQSAGARGTGLTEATPARSVCMLLTDILHSCLDPLLLTLHTDPHLGKADEKRNRRWGRGAS